ncbi:MAG TPA: hypothetical protein VNA44_06815 [Burkholderiaceae bacterium]|nr:hypothetical protein [Burkholderiaceae bacterium]
MVCGRRQALVAFLLAPALLRAQQVADQHLPPLGDLRVLAKSIARQKAPLLILFSTPGCPFCREVRRNYLVPRIAEQADKTNPQLLLRETDITSERTMVDLSGAHITESFFAARNNVRVVPVVTLFDASLRPISEPLVGLDRSGFYEGYLTSAIDAARKHLRQTS